MTNKRLIQKENLLPRSSDLLQRELASRMASNARYTLRAFARDAGIYPSKMSEILRGKGGVSGKRAQIIARRLKWDSETTEAFCKMAISESSRSPKKRMEAKTALQEMFNENNRQLTEREFRLVADWYHLAALSLAEILGGVIGAQELIKYLGITRREAADALTRLASSDFLETTDQQRYLLKVASTVTPSVRSSAAIRSFHGQMLEKARVALHQQSNEERDNSAVILTMKKENVDRAKKLIQDFRKKFMQLMSSERSDELDSVYCLSLQLFELAHVQKSKGEEK